MGGGRKGQVIDEMRREESNIEEEEEVRGGEPAEKENEKQYHFPELY